MEDLPRNLSIFRQLFQKLHARSNGAPLDLITNKHVHIGDTTCAHRKLETVETNARERVFMSSGKRRYFLVHVLFCIFKTEDETIFQSLELG